MDNRRRRQPGLPTDARRSRKLQAPRSPVLVPGVELTPLVGAAQRCAKAVHGPLDPGAPRLRIRFIRDPVPKLSILLEGEVAVDVEDRRYRLGTIDAMTIPGRVAATAGEPLDQPPCPDPRFAGRVGSRANLGQRPFHSGRATGPLRPAFRARNDSVAMIPPAGSSSPRGPSSRICSAASSAAQGICGGYGVFEPGARLPCHRHEFDESITIVQGTATCVVEGRRHELSRNATALVPQGLCHYFINLTLDPMAMIWVYAGDKPDRIVMDESYCHPEKARK